MKRIAADLGISLMEGVGFSMGLAGGCRRADVLDPEEWSRGERGQRRRA